MMNKILLLIVCAGVIMPAGCASKAVLPKSAEQILVPEALYNTQALNLAVTYRQQLADVVAGIRSRYHFTELEFTGPTKESHPNGLTFCYREGQSESNEIFLCLSMFTTTRIDSHETIYSMRSTRVFRRYGRDLLEILQASGIPDDEEVAGISLTLWWHVDDFLNQTNESKGEGFNIFAPKETLRLYVNNEIDGQEFLRQCRVMGDKNRQLLGEVEIGESDQ